ncbi:unnamed protein product [[Candida] boidinii]|nr:unnamed protein product [[Candida] boidinii]
MNSSVFKSTNSSLNNPMYNSGNFNNKDHVNNNSNTNSNNNSGMGLNNYDYSQMDNNNFTTNNNGMPIITPKEAANMANINGSSFSRSSTPNFTSGMQLRNSNSNSNSNINNSNNNNNSNTFNDSNLMNNIYIQMNGFNGINTNHLNENRINNNRNNNSDSNSNFYNPDLPYTNDLVNENSNSSTTNGPLTGMSNMNNNTNNVDNIFNNGDTNTGNSNTANASDTTAPSTTAAAGNDNTSQKSTVTQSLEERYATSDRFFLYDLQNMGLTQEDAYILHEEYFDKANAIYFIPDRYII